MQSESCASAFKGSSVKTIQTTNAETAILVRVYIVPLIACNYLSGQWSISRFNRHLHALGDWLLLVVKTLGELFATGETYMIDSMPVPVCRRVQTWRCHKVCGRIYCAAKDEQFFGWRSHLICTLAGEPVHFTLLPTSLHEPTSVHKLTDALPTVATLLGEKTYISAPEVATILADSDVRLVAQVRSDMQTLDWWNELDLRTHRHTIETVNSQLKKMALEHLCVCTNPGFFLNVHTSIVALALTNFN